jgi:hypothetical protein
VGFFERRVRVLGSEALALYDDSLSEIVVRLLLLSLWLPLRDLHLLDVMERRFCPLSEPNFNYYKVTQQVSKASLNCGSRRN